eukprot:scaffold7817_cov277-Pinguiococcus_pyrenoidosus.AAC.2
MERDRERERVSMGLTNQCSFSSSFSEEHPPTFSRLGAFSGLTAWSTVDNSNKIAQSRRSTQRMSFFVRTRIKKATPQLVEVGEEPLVYSSTTVLSQSPLKFQYSSRAFLSLHICQRRSSELARQSEGGLADLDVAVAHHVQNGAERLARSTGVMEPVCQVLEDDRILLEVLLGQTAALARKQARDCLESEGKGALQELLGREVAGVEHQWHQLGPKYRASPGSCLTKYIMSMLSMSWSSVIGKVKNVGMDTDCIFDSVCGATKSQVFVPISWKVSESIGAQCSVALMKSRGKFEDVRQHVRVGNGLEARVVVGVIRERPRRQVRRCVLVKRSHVRNGDLAAGGTERAREVLEVQHAHLAPFVALLENVHDAASVRLESILHQDGKATRVENLGDVVDFRRADLRDHRNGHGDVRWVVRALVTVMSDVRLLSLFALGLEVSSSPRASRAPESCMRPCTWA